MPHHRPQPVVPYHIIYDNNVKVDSAHERVDLKEARINTLETDKALKDLKILELENDKTSKDTAMAALTARLVTLENGGGSSSGSGSMSSEVVNWTNLTEINLSGEKLTNGDFSQLTRPNLSQTVFTSADIGREIIGLQDKPGRGLTVGGVCTITSVVSSNATTTCGGVGIIISALGEQWTWNEAVYPTNWSVNSPIGLDQDKLDEGIIKGVGGAVSIQQMFSNPIASGTKLVVKVTRADTNEDGAVRVSTLRANGTPYGSNKNIPYADGYVAFETTETTYGLRLSTAHGTRSVSSISVFQGVVSGGSVQAYAGGSIEKISGGTAWNTGASSVQKISGNSDGYFQFQWAGLGKSQRVGLTYLDDTYTTVTPFQLTISGNGNIVVKTFNGGVGWATLGDWFRIRHYSANNQIKYQKKQTIYQADTTASYQVGTKIIMLKDFGSAVKDEILTVFALGASGVPIFEQSNNNQFGAQAQVTAFGRAIWWEVAEDLGEDYVTFYTDTTLTNGSDLYLDTTLFNVGSQLNDVTIVR